MVDDRTAWELYYPPFEAGVAAGAGDLALAPEVLNEEIYVYTYIEIDRQIGR